MYAEYILEKGMATHSSIFAWRAPMDRGAWWAQKVRHNWVTNSNDITKYITQNARLDESQAGIKIAGRNINNLRYEDDTTLMAENEEELKSLLMTVQENSEKAGLKLNILKTKIMAASPITSWQIGKKQKQWQILFSWVPKSPQMVTAAMKLKDICSLEGKLWVT